MTKHLTLLLFIGMAWGQDDNKIKIMPNDKWIISQEINPLDDTKTIALLLQSESGINHYGEKIDLVIRCKSSKIDIFINWGVFLGSDLSLTTRIDKENAVNEEWSLSSNKKASFSYTPIALTEKLIQSNKYVAKVTPYNENPIVAIFDLKGLVNKIKIFDGHCNFNESDGYDFFLNNISIESVARLGKKTYVIIDGVKYEQGNEISGFIIDNIDNDEITFRKGEITFKGIVGN